MPLYVLNAFELKGSKKAICQYAENSAGHEEINLSSSSSDWALASRFPDKIKQNRNIPPEETIV